MKNLKDLKEVNLLNKKAQTEILGGKIMCTFHVDTPPTCPPGYICVGKGCELLPPILD
jgi:hypothetical protein